MLQIFDAAPNELAPEGDKATEGAAAATAAPAVNPVPQAQRVTWLKAYAQSAAAARAALEQVRAHEMETAEPMDVHVDAPVRWLSVYGGGDSGVYVCCMAWSVHDELVPSVPSHQRLCHLQ